MQSGGAVLSLRQWQAHCVLGAISSEERNPVGV